MKRLINIRPPIGAAIFLGLLPFFLMALLYSVNSAKRLQENPDDRLLPSFTQLVEGVKMVAVNEDPRTGQIVLWADTRASLQRIGIAIAASALVGLVFGMMAGMLPYLRALNSPTVTTLSLVPPMAILPILFVAFGLDEFSKILLIVIGVAPFLIRDLQARVMEIPAEMLIKAQSLGASSWQIALRVVLPQVLPRLVDSVRLSLGAAWIFLISAEAIAAEQGLGYRIFLVRRYMSMDIILPYVVWITLLAFTADRLLYLFNRQCFPWLQGRKPGHA
ncbi:MAG: ABC transporter permease subunit [Moraxellaceae bacterium]|nr:ABC transporter permease subunit [Moraxellaceae bacterium]